ncbi:hypothetical protein CAS74_003218 [Pichia kudriavzevii]|uniref:NADP-dependent oxidoreductase domain-containing protein n=1 Tax=Pichia kudriavzevii TaxID=4909 RepID=A0A1Z8JNR6_PICKU|nr:hypothetical protein CAS74_003218 [Pichia kudriavzevii]
MTKRTITLPRTNDEIPIIGFGSGTKWQWKKKGSEETAISKDNPSNTDPDLVASIVQALETGFTHLDTAEFYTTRPDVGKGVNDYLAKYPNKSRSDIWVTDKYNSVTPNDYDNGPLDGKIRGPYQSLKEGLKLMNLDYVDLFLLHTTGVPEGLTMVDVWNEMIQLQKEGLAKNIGTSNFDIPNLQVIKDNCEVLPQVNQIEFHPYLQDQSVGIRKFCKENNIQIEAYGPLIPITKCNEGPLIPLLDELAQKYDVSNSKILLKWVHMQNIVTVTTSSKVERMKDVLSVHDFQLSEEDFSKISEVGNTYFFRAFPIPPLPTHDEQLKQIRNVINK